MSRFEGRIGRYFDESEPWWPPFERAPDGAPNIVMVVLDDVGFAQLGCYGSDISTTSFDGLARDGLRFTNFHTTAVCSATRVCLLTGRNHHSSGMGRVIEVATGFPGYNAHIPRESGFLSEILQNSGYSTFAIGKWHLTAEDECHAAGKRRDWPCGRGFDRFYGFMGGETHQFVPALVEDNHNINAVPSFDSGYHLTSDLVAKAIGCIRDVYVVDPDRPFFLYLAPGACHAPHQVPAEWIERCRGQFDEGWDVWRERTLTRQIESGVMAPGTRLSPLPSWVPSWDSLTPDQRRLYARYMETYASFLSHTDDQVGRLLQFLSDIGKLDDTLVLVLSDNGASSEGGPTGTMNLSWGPQRKDDQLSYALTRIDELGGPRCLNNYPWGWTVAGNTPFQRWKREVHEGGVADPLIVYWPARFGQAGGFRRQYAHAIDLLPTVLDLAGISAPAEVDGIAQSPIHGTSLAAICTDANAPEVRTTQYYEMFGSRAIYHDGWKAVAHHPYMTDPEPDRPFDEDPWELYHVAVDVSECDDLAGTHPAKLAQLQQLWWAEAGRYQVLPLDNRPLSAFTLDKPSSVPLRSRYVYLPDAAQIPEAAAVSVKNRSHTVTADVELSGNAHGVLISQGSFLGGWCLYVQDSRLNYVHNLSSQELTHIRSQRTVPPGRHSLGFRFDRTGHNQGRGTLLVDGAEVAGGEIHNFTPVRFSATGAGLTCGYSNGLPVTDEFVGPFRFTGRLKSVTIEVDGEPLVDGPGAARVAITSQ
jgi:arylsulfatase